MIEAMAINLNQLQRLAFIRFLHQVGVDQARKPDPFSSAAILSLHDAVESFLLLVAEHFGVTSREFEKYWKEFEQHLPTGTSFPEKASMARLNRTRVALKHHGSQPNKQTVDQAVGDVATFFSASTQLVFGVDYGSISMTDLMSQPEAKAITQEAEQHVLQGDFVSAMICLREAFEALFDPHLPDEWHRGPLSPFAFGRPLDSLRRSARQAARSLGRETSSQDRFLDLRDFIEEVSKLEEILRPMQDGLRLAALSIDYAEFLRFDQLLPQHDDLADGDRVWSASLGYAPDQEEFDFCLQFVVTASLRLATAEAQVTEPKWMTRNRWGGRQSVQLRRGPRRGRSTSGED